MHNRFKKMPVGKSLAVFLAVILSTAVAASGEVVEIEWQSPIARDHPLVGAVYQQSGATTPDALLELMAGSKYILIGEKHDNPDHQLLELYLLKSLVAHNADANAPPSVSVTLEMIDDSRQPELDEVMWQLEQDDQLQIETDLLKGRLNWPEHGWPWSDYSALITWTLNSRLLLAAGNISRETMQTIYKSGIDDRFGSAIALKDSLDDALLDQVFDGHCGLMPRDSLSSMVNVQLVKDAAMANALVASGGRHSVLIAGSGHIRKDSAVPKHLQSLDDGAVLTVAMVEVDSEKQSAADYQALFERFDILVFTPIANQRDYCSDFKKSMQKK